jgi:threonine synthase
LYTCPDCGQVLLIHDRRFDTAQGHRRETWQQIFDYRRMLKIPAVKGIYRYHEFIGPVHPLDAVVYLGEGHTPVVEANGVLQEKAASVSFTRMTARTPAHPSRTGAWPAP